MVSAFHRLHPRLQEAVVARLGWGALRPIQEAAGGVIGRGANAVVLAPTAGGKTEAAIFPILSGILEDQDAAPGAPGGVAALYIAPIKALLNNQRERLGRYTEMVGLRRAVWHGDVPAAERRAFLREPAELLMTTPESLEVMLISPKVDTAALFAGLRWVVIDEIHAMAGTDRGAHLMSVLERIAPHSRHDVQRIGLSATVGNPEAILGWMQGSSRRAAEVVDLPRPPVRRSLAVQYRPSMEALAQDAAAAAKGRKSLLFCPSRAMTEETAALLKRAGTAVFVHHSAVSREERERAEERFTHGTDACVVCTSTLELGIDVGDLDRVLQVDAPDTVSSFLQRMGRTGRRPGQVANTTFLCASSDAVLQAAALIGLARRGWVEPVTLGGRCWPVLIHQVLAMTLAGGGVTPDAAWRQLQRAPDFRGIRRAEFDRLLAWMLRDGGLALLDGRLLPGPKAERRFSRRNFMDLYAVFESPQSYTVETGEGHPIGTLSQGFVDRLSDGVSCFLLGGRPWIVRQIRHSERVVGVGPAPRGTLPTWGGFTPQFLGRALCEEMRAVLRADDVWPWLSPEAAAALQEWRAALQPLLGGDGIEEAAEGGAAEVRWWTFAGGRINSTLRYALLAVGGDWKIIPDNTVLRLRGEGMSRARLLEAIGRIIDPEFWEDQRLWREVAAGLPGYRLSKFQPLMPPWVERETLAGFLLDVGGTWEWLREQRSLPGRETAPEAAPERVTAPETAPERETAAPEQETAPKRETAPEPEPETAAPEAWEREPEAWEREPEAWEREPEQTREEQTQQERVRERRARAGRDIARGPLGTPVEWVRHAPGLEAACARLAGEPVVALDVETTMYTQQLCLVQLCGRGRVYLIDPLEVEDLEPLRRLLGEAGVKKVIHNATFERSVLGKHGIEIVNVEDTMVRSRELRGRKLEGGHSLKAVCLRELGTALDKEEQTSDWQRRPLSLSQQSYAAMDVEILLRLYDHLSACLSAQGGGLFGAHIGGSRIDA